MRAGAKLLVVPEFLVHWSFCEAIEAADERAAVKMTRHRIETFVEPDKFSQVERSIFCTVEPIPPDRGRPGHTERPDQP